MDGPRSAETRPSCRRSSTGRGRLVSQPRRDADVPRVAVAWGRGGWRGRAMAPVLRMPMRCSLSSGATRPIGSHDGIGIYRRQYWPHVRNGFALHAGRASRWDASLALRRPGSDPPGTRPDRHRHQRRPHQRMARRHPACEDPSPTVRDGVGTRSSRIAEFATSIKRSTLAVSGGVAGGVDQEAEEVGWRIGQQ